MTVTMPATRFVIRLLFDATHIVIPSEQFFMSSRQRFYVQNQLIPPLGIDSPKDGAYSQAGKQRPA